MFEGADAQLGNYFLFKAAAAFAVVLLCSEGVRSRIERGLLALGAFRSVVLFAASRCVLFLLAFGALGLKPPGDAVAWSRIVHGDAGEVSPYSPSFNALLSTLWQIRPSPLTFVAAMSIAEILAFATFWYGMASGTGKRFLPLLAFWLVNPVSMFHVALGGQDEALTLLAWCGVAWAAVKGRPVQGGFIGALGMLASKVLTGLACLPLIVLPRRRAGAGILTCIGTLAVGVALFLWRHERVTLFLTELAFPTTGNLWALLELLGLTSADRPVVFGLGLTAAALAGCIVFVRSNPVGDVRTQALRMTGMAGCVFLMMSPKSPTAWMVMFLPGILFLTLTLEQRARRFIIGVFFPVSIFEPSMWFYFSQGAGSSHARAARPTLLMADAVLVVGYGLLIVQGVRLGGRPAVALPDLA